jgi:hypothetical protein
MSTALALRSMSTTHRTMFSRCVVHSAGIKLFDTIGSGLTNAPAGSLRNVYLVVRDLKAAGSRLLERGVEVDGIRHTTPIDTWMGALLLGSPPRLETTSVSPASRTRMATAGCCKSAGLPA